MTTQRRIAVVHLATAYLGAQAVATVVWWVGLATSQEIRGWFELDPSRPRILDAFVIADVVVFAGGSAVTAVALARRVRWAPVAAAAAASGAAYATLFLVGWVVLGGHGWIGIPPMLAATGASAAVTVVAHRA